MSCIFIRFLEAIGKIHCVPRITFNYSPQHQDNLKLKLTHVYAFGGGELQPEHVGYPSLLHLI